MPHKTPRELAIDFGLNTTCHGLRQLAEVGRPFFIRVVWAAVLAMLLGGMCWQLIIRVMEYTEFATNTKLHEEFAPYIEFPYVSICNYNRFFNITDRSELAAVDGLVRLSSPTRKREEDAEWEYYIREYYSNETHVALLSDEVEKRGWPLSENTISSCTFHHKPCSYKSFKPFITTMGRCFTFIAHEKTQTIPGHGHGLRITLNLMQDYYTEHPDYGKPEAGIKVHVHHGDDPPMVEELGTAAPAGMIGLVSVKKVERELMQSPWGICNPQPKAMKYHPKYSFAECMTECRIDYIIEKCGCKPYWARHVETCPECNAWQILNCSGSTEADSLNLTPDECGCDQPCSSVGFTQSLSYATYPGVLVGEILAKDEETIATGHNLSKSIESHIVIPGQDLNVTEFDPYRVKLNAYRDNHLMLDVYFETLSFTKITQSKKISEMSLASDFGGLLGLWLGISFVTIAEFIQFFGQVCAMTLNKSEKTNATNRRTEVSAVPAWDEVHEDSWPV